MLLWANILFVLAALASLFALYLILSQREEDAFIRDAEPGYFRFFKPFIYVLLPVVRPIFIARDFSATQKHIDVAGLHYVLLPIELVALRLSGVLLSVFVLQFAWMMKWGDAIDLLTAFIFMSTASLYMPTIWLSMRIKQRQRFIGKAFPFFLDLLVLALKSGQNYSAALDQAIASTPPSPLKEELNRVQREIKTGKDRFDAMQDLARRVDINEMTAFISVLNQSQQTGAELTSLLENQASQRRKERLNQAEAAANKAPVKLLLPLVLFLFPIVFMLVGFILLVKMADSNYLPPRLQEMLEVRQ
jgi:tight adherence protein C